jgi:transposase, IS30 family
VAPEDHLKKHGLDPGSNENTTRLLRPCLPKGSDLRVHSAADLDAVAQALNSPQQTLEWKTSRQALSTVGAIAA